MSKNKQINHKGFTLLEILLVIGIIGILAAIVIIAINPGRSLAKSRDLQRKVGITEINKALSQYYIDNNQYPSTVTPYLTSICPTGSSATSSGFNCGDLGLIDLSMLVPTYLPSIPVDPTGVGYKIGLNTSRRIMLVANLTETVSPIIAIGTTTYPVVLDTSPTIVLGDGSVGNPYQVNNWSQLNQVRDVGFLDKNYILMSSLDSSTFGYATAGANWVPVGDFGLDGDIYSTGDNNIFSGSFNGNNNTISNLVISKPSNNAVGLFGNVSGNISNLGLVNVSVTGSSYTGGLVGSQEGGTITNVYTSGTVAGSNYTGGLVGHMIGGSVVSSYSSASVTGSSRVGGLVGQQWGTGTISKSYSTGNVIGSTRTGGLAGYVTESAGISNCYATGNATSTSYTGGLVGYLDGPAVTNSYSTGYVANSTNSGGLIGYSYSSSVSASHWDQTTSGKATSAGGAGATGTTTAGMKIASFYTGWSNSIWNIADGSYPTLKP